MMGIGDTISIISFVIIILALGYGIYTTFKTKENNRVEEEA